MQKEQGLAAYAAKNYEAACQDFYAYLSENPQDYEAIFYHGMCTAHMADLSAPDLGFLCDAMTRSMRTVSTVKPEEAKAFAVKMHEETQSLLQWWVMNCCPVETEKLGDIEKAKSFTRCLLEAIRLAEHSCYLLVNDYVADDKYLEKQKKDGLTYAISLCDAANEKRSYRSGERTVETKNGHKTEELYSPCVLTHEEQSALKAARGRLVAEYNALPSLVGKISSFDQRIANLTEKIEDYEEALAAHLSRIPEQKKMYEAKPARKFFVGASICLVVALVLLIVAVVKALKATLFYILACVVGAGMVALLVFAVLNVQKQKKRRKSIEAGFSEELLRQKEAWHNALKERKKQLKAKKKFMAGELKK